MSMFMMRRHDALALGADAIVISVDYRHAPEHKFPPAHNDAWATYVWTVENGGSVNGDTKRIAVAGESAGANLAANVALMAKERKTQMPIYQLLVYPVAGNGMTTPSYNENADAVPLGKKDMQWFVANVFASKDETSDPRLNLVARNDLPGVAGDRNHRPDRSAPLGGRGLCKSAPSGWCSR
jgi:acetyl esterase/lipase